MMALIKGRRRAHAGCLAHGALTLRNWSATNRPDRPIVRQPIKPGIPIGVTMPAPCRVSGQFQGFGGVPLRNGVPCRTSGRSDSPSTPYT